MRLLQIFILFILMLTFFGIGRVMYQDDNTINIYNYTSTLAWNESIFDKEIKSINESTPVKEINIIRLKNIIYKVINAGGYVTFEIAKWGIEVGFKKPEWDYLFFIRLLLYLFIILYLIPLLPYIIAMLYLAYKGVEWIGFIRLFKKLKK